MNVGWKSSLVFAEGVDSIDKNCGLVYVKRLLVQMGLVPNGVQSISIFGHYIRLPFGISGCRSLVCLNLRAPFLSKHIVSFLCKSMDWSDLKSIWHDLIS